MTAAADTIDDPAAPPSLRTDRVMLRKPERLPSGGRRGEMVVARVGLHRYAWGVELVHADALSDPDHIAAYEGVPIYDGVTHPDPSSLTAAQREEARIGTVLSARWDAAERAVVARYVLDTQRGEAVVRRGWRQVSPYYHADTVRRDGTHDGQPYTYVQTRRYRIDHVLITPQGRGGREVEIRLDSANTQGGPVADTDVKAALAEALAPLVADLAHVKERADALAERIPEPPANDEGPTGPRFDSAAAIVKAVADGKIDVPDGASIEDAARLVVAKAVGKERADALPAESLDAVIATAAAIRPAPRQEYRPSVVHGDSAGKSGSTVHKFLNPEG